MADKTSTMKTKLEIDGEKAYKDACTGINTSLKTLGTEMRLVTAQYVDNAKGAEALGAKQGVLKKTLEEQNKKVEEAEKALKQLKDAGFDDTNPTVQKFQQNLNNAKAEVAKTENELKSIDKELKSSKANWEAVGGAVAKGAKAFATGIAVIGAAAGAAATALVAAAVSGSNYADDLMTQSTYTRQSTDDLQKYAYAARFVDVDMEKLTGSMTKNIKSMKSARDGSAAYADTYKQLGVSVSNADGTLRDSNDVYWETIDALGKIENETERDALAMQVFGKSAQELNSVIGAGSEAFKAYGNEAEEMGVVMSGENLNRLGAFNDQLQVLGAGMEGLKNNASLIALPFLEVLATDGISVLKEFSKGINDANGDVGKMADVVGNTLASVVNVIAKRLPEFVNMGVTLINSLITGIVNNIPAIATAAVQIVTSLCDGLISMLPLILNGAAQLIIGLAQGIAQALPQLLPKMVEVITALVQTLIQNIPMLIDAALQLVIGLAQGLLAAIPVLIAAIPEIITSLITAILESIPLIIQTGIDLLVALIQALPQIITTIAGAIPQIVEGITTALIGNIDKIIMAGVQLFIALIQNLPTIIAEIVKAVPQIITGIVDTFGALMGRIVDIGGNLLKGIWDGITGAADWLWDKMSGFFGGLVDNVKNFLGIHSPSTVFAEVGGNMALGIGEGFGDNMGGVGGDMQAAVGGAGSVTAQEAISAINNGIISNVAQLDQAVTAIVQRVSTSLTAQNPKFKNQGVEIDKNLASGMVSGIVQITAKVPQITTAIITAFTAQNPKFKNQGVEIDKNIASGMVSGIVQITAKVPQITTAIITAFTAQNPKFKNQGVEIDKNIASGMVSGIQQITAKIQQIVTPIINALNGYTQSFVSAGENMVRGIWKGFQNMSGWLESKVRAMMREIVHAVEEEMDINSPSEVFAGIGEYMAQGIGVGFGREMRAVEKLLRATMPKEIEVDAPVKPRNPPGRFARGEEKEAVGGVSVTQNFYNEGNDYAKQQREAAKQFKIIAREIG